MKNYGYQEPILEEKDYIFGATLTPKIINPSGQWLDFVPKKEIQRNQFIDSYNCTAYGSLEQLETLVKKQFGDDWNKSERFTGIEAGTYPPGNDPQKVYESIRKDGVIDESLLPFNETIQSVDVYYSLDNPGVCVREGQNWLDLHDFYHDWVITRFTPKDRKANLLKEALKSSPLGVSVYAWTERDGLYVKEDGDADNHWTLLVGYEDGKYWIVSDSYDKTIKHLAWGYNFTWAKRIDLRKRTMPRAKANYYIEILKNIRDLLTSIYNKLGSQEDLQRRTFLMQLQLLQLQLANIMSKMPPETEAGKKLYEVAKSCLGKDMAPTQNIYGCAEALNTVVRKAFGWSVGGGASTYWLNDALSRNPKFYRLTDNSKAKPGDIIISPSGWGNGKLSNGHVGIVGENGKILSNNSESYLWDDHLTIDWWNKYYKDYGGFPVHIFRPDFPC